MSYVLGIGMNYGLVGVWTAFPFALSIAGILYYRVFKRSVAEMEKEK